MKLIEYVQTLRICHAGVRLPAETLERNRRINEGHGEAFFKAWDAEFNLRPL